MSKEVKFLEYDCKLVKGEYVNGGTSLELVDVQDGQPVAVASVYVEGVDLKEDEVLIKNYSENAGIMEALMIQDVIGGPIDTVPTGNVMVTKHKLL